MEKRPEEYPMYDELFDAADMSYLSNEEMVSYGQSRMKLEDDREGLLYYGEQQLKKGIEQGKKEGIKEGIKEGKKEGELSMLRNIIQMLKNKGMSLKEVVATLDFPKNDIEMLWD